MTNSSNPSRRGPIRCGCRDSPLSLIQSQNSLDHLGALLPELKWRPVPFSSPGDRDRRTDLRMSPKDFFTRDLDEAVLEGRIDVALHSAKDLPPEGREGIDWFWLPWAEDGDDALILRPGEIAESLGPGSRIGVSSHRRTKWCATRFPDARLEPIRGNIGDRLNQLDRGDFDGIIMAVAALNRLGLAHRVGHRIPPNELPTPPGQGRIAVTFRDGDSFFRRLRALLCLPVRIVGAGAGSAEWITEKGAEAVAGADVCLYDALIDARLLERLPGGCEAVPVGKRSGVHSRSQKEICRLLADYARRGGSVVRLKGGDPGMFGRLNEEVDTLEALGFPYLVYPGLSALSLATTGTGLLLTRRGRSRGFQVMTPIRSENGAPRLPEEGDLPAAFFMSVGALDLIRNHYLDRGTHPQTACALVFDAGTSREEIVTLPLVRLDIGKDYGGRVGLVLIGVPGTQPYANLGPLAGAGVLLTCSRNLMPRAVRGVEDAGGRPVIRPLITQEIRTGSLPDPERIAMFDWIVLTSPTAIRLFFDAYRDQGGDCRRLPKIMTCGSASAHALAARGIIADLVPESGSDASSLTAAAEKVLTPGETVLRLRSDAAGTGLSKRLAGTGADVEDLTFYHNLETVPNEDPPPFDAVFFASSSAVRAFTAAWGAEILKKKTILTLGQPTVDTLKSVGIEGALTAEHTDAYGAFETLKLHYFRRSEVNES